MAADRNVKRVEISPGRVRTFEINLDVIEKQIVKELQEFVYEAGDNIKFDATTYEFYLKGGIKEVTTR